MMMNKPVPSNVVLVQLVEPYRGQSLWLFGSKRAIYDHLPAEVVGIAYNTLANRHSLRTPFVNGKCTITRVVLLRAAHKTKTK